MRFKEFYPAFRDSISGLIFLHLKNIAHRWIKPSSIIKIRHNKYILGDLGWGINLNAYGNNKI